MLTEYWHIVPTPTPAPTPAAWLSSLAQAGPTLSVILQYFAVAAFFYGIFRGTIDLVRFIKRPRLRAYMSRDVWPVALPSQSELALNIQFVVHNPGKRTAFLRELTARLTRPDFTEHIPAKTFDLRWRVFIMGNPTGMEQTEPTYVQVVPPGEAKLVSVQLLGDYERNDCPLREHCFDWFPGLYTLSLSGLVNKKWQKLSGWWSKGWSFQISDQQSSVLSPTTPFSPPHALSIQLTE